MKRNTFIDCAKLVYAIPIMLVHSNYLAQGVYDWRTTPVIMPSGYVAVEFFFILSGFLMASTAAKYAESKDKLGSEAASFVWTKVKIILPFYLVAWVLSFMVKHMSEQLSARMMLKNAVYSFFAFFRVDMGGFIGYDPIGSGWYISAMLMIMLLIYPLLRCKRNVFVWSIAPLLTLFIYGYISQTRGNISAASVWIGLTYVGILRAIAGLSLGCTCHAITQKIKTVMPTKLASILLTILEVGCYIIPLIIMQIRKHTQLDFIMIFLFATAITISFSGLSYSNRIFKKPYPWMAEMSLCIYLVHECGINFVKYFFPSYDLWKRLPIFVVFSLLVSILTYVGGNHLKVVWNKYKHKIAELLFIKP